MMERRTILYLGLILAVLLWFLHYFALIFYLYWIFGWYDTMTHFLGGLALGVFVIGLFNLETRTIGSFLTLFVLVMITGVLWEWIEYVNDIAVVSGENYALDTIHDIVMDALGAITAYFIILRSRESF